MKHTRARAALLALSCSSAQPRPARETTTTPTPTGTDETTTTAGDGGGEATAARERRLRRPRGGVPGRRRRPAPPPPASPTPRSTSARSPTRAVAGAPVSTRRCTTPPWPSPTWCNEHGGILGRELVVDDADAKLFEYEAAHHRRLRPRTSPWSAAAPCSTRTPTASASAAACRTSPATSCRSAAARADLQVQPLPNPVDQVAAGRYQAAKAQFPDGIEHYGIMTRAPRRRSCSCATSSSSVAEGLGFTVDYQDRVTRPGRDRLGQLRQRDQGQGHQDPRVRRPARRPRRPSTRPSRHAGLPPGRASCSAPTSTTAPTPRRRGAIAGNIFIQSAFHPFELAADNKATQDYLDLMEQYNPDGKIALLGTQGAVGWLLFAQAATECGSDLTAECLSSRRRPRRTGPAAGCTRRRRPGNDEPSPCFLVLDLDADGFFYNEEVTAPTDGDGLYNCDPENVARRERLSVEEFLRPHRPGALHRLHLRPGRQRPRAHVHDHRHLQLRPRGDRDARRVRVLAAPRRLGVADPARAGGGAAGAGAAARARRSSAGSCATSPTRPRPCGSWSRSACSSRSSASGCGCGRPTRPTRSRSCSTGTRFRIFDVGIT